MKVTRERPATKQAPQERFSGHAWMDVLAPPTSVDGLEVLSVHFAPGARTAWHAHPRGQVLIVTEGVGLAQAKGAALEHIQVGDTVVAEAGEWHWHGAGPGSFMTHTAVQGAAPDGSTAEWGDHVGDDQYLSG
jgi:quercetin dioxygenase-like cupin family protein